jgi:hypothetical protein
MEASMATRLSDIVAALDVHVRHVRRLGLKQSALLLDMAKLDLQMRIHEITDLELDELCKVIERQDDAAPAASPAPPQVKIAAACTVISLFGRDRFSPQGRGLPDKSADPRPARGERRVRGKTVVPR